MAYLDSLSLTTEQRDALAQLRAITSSGVGNDGQADERMQHERAILESVGWDVELAANAIFSAPPSLPPSRPKPSFEPFVVDDSAQRISRQHTPSQVNPHSFPTRIFLSLLSLAAFPITLTFNIVSHIFRFFRIPVPRAPLSFTLSSLWSRGGIGRLSRNGGGRIPEDAVLAAERLMRDLEDETGAVTVSRACAIQAEAAPRAGPSRAFTSIFDDTSRKFLPDFHLGSYESALQLIRRDARPLCVILLSEEHEDTPAFKRDVLTNVDFVRALTEGEFIVWAGDIRGPEGHQTSLKLSATTYPFVAFIALQPRLPPRSRPAPTSTSTPTSLTIISRHPSSTSPAPLTVAALTTHISTAVIPRVTPLRLQAMAREEERRLRDEQDAAFRAAEQADGDRIRRKRHEEEAARERERLEAARLHRASMEAKEKQRMVEVYKEWLGKASKRLSPEPEAGKGLRVGVRLPSGVRSIRRFGESQPVSDIYTWVGALLHNVEPIDGEVDAEYSPQHNFKLVVAFPRSEVPYLVGQAVGEIDALRGGANLVVEGFASRENGADAGESESDEDDK
ncbi:hypothetical protein BU17DRAFT_38224 [Hysterangium stoloniferum]|nr:hypothetical protein BU17DRAFT_38224 [Hysterangium stoloniferum]